MDKMQSEGRRAGDGRARIYVPVIFGVMIALAIVAVWFAPPRRDLAERVPDEANILAAASAAKAGGPAEGALVPGSGAPAPELPGHWPQFRGPKRDGIDHESSGYARAWPAAGPPMLWSIEVGEGYAGPVVHKGCVYLLDYDRENQADALRCLSLADGSEIWRFAYPVPVKRNHGMSRTLPAVTDEYIVSIGPKCHVICLETATGKLLWSMDLVTEYGSEVPDWYAGQCPYIVDGRVILAPAGPDVMLMSVDCATGEEVWRTPNPRKWKMTHSSVTPMSFSGSDLLLYCASGGVVGVNAADGSLLWTSDAWKVSIANIASPLPFEDGRIFFSGGYNSGSMMAQLTRGSDGGFTMDELYRLKAREYGSTQQTPVLLKDHILGIRPNGDLVCLALDGTLVWASGKDYRFGLGPMMLVDGLILAMDDFGTITMAEASVEAFKPLGSFAAFDGHDAWGPFATAGTRVICRDFTTMRCFDFGAQ